MVISAKGHNLNKVSILPVVLFYLIAVITSAVLASDFALKWFEVVTEGTLARSWTFLPAGAGTLLAAFLAFKYDSSIVRIISLRGANFKKNLFLTVTPVFVFSVLGLENKAGYDAHLYGLIFSLVSMGYAICEEIFWRGYMLDALRNWNKWLYPLIIGLVWWAWHLRFFSVFDYTWFLLVCISGSYLLCYTTNLTRSYMTAGAFHAILVITTTSGQFTKEKMYGILMSVLIWIAIGFFWETSNQAEE